MNGNITCNVHGLYDKLDPALALGKPTCNGRSRFQLHVMTQEYRPQYESCQPESMLCAHL